VSDRTVDQIAAIAAGLTKMAEDRRKWAESCKVTNAYLQPEMDKFDSRQAPCDTYTVRIYVDHMSEIRRHEREASDLEAAVDILRAHILGEQK